MSEDVEPNSEGRRGVIIEATASGGWLVRGIVGDIPLDGPTLATYASTEGLLKDLYDAFCEEVEGRAP